VKAGLLQLQDRRGNSWGQHHAINKMVGEFGGYLPVRFVIRVLPA
jgi:hypothetical protein